MYPVSPQDPWVQIAEIIRLIRRGEAQTRPELADATRLGRNIITQRIQVAHELGMVRPSGDLRSRGGRAAEVWEFHGARGRILVGMVSLTGFTVALTDLDLSVLEDRWVPWDSPDPQDMCERMATEMDDLLRTHHHEGPAWGIGIGVPTPVDFLTGRSATPVTSSAPGIDWSKQFDVRRWFTKRLRAPVWVDSMSNLAALGAAAEPGAPDDLVFVRMGRGLGCGIMSDGRLHRGSDWIAGEIAHIVVNPDSDRICLCGRIGCLDALASRWALEAEARRASADARSGYLSGLPAAPDLQDIVRGAAAGDATCAELVLRAADAMGRALGSVITWFNPRRVVIGGNALAESGLFQGAVNRALSAYTLTASIQHLQLHFGSAQRPEEVRGAAAMVTESLLAPSYLAEWGPKGFPIDVDELLAKQVHE